MEFLFGNYNCILPSILFLCFLVCVLVFCTVEKFEVFCSPISLIVTAFAFSCFFTLRLTLPEIVSPGEKLYFSSWISILPFPKPNMLFVRLSALFIFCFGKLLIL